MAESRNWADLPRELIRLISKKLPADRAYGLRFRAVCKNWRSIVPLSDLPPLLPWLIEREQPDWNSYLGPNLRFYSLSSKETGKIHVPKFYQGMLYYGPGHGYLLVASLGGDLFLLDPLAGDAISLPKLNDELRIWCLGCSGSDPVRNLHVSCDIMEDGIEGATAAVYHADQNDWTYVQVSSDHAAQRTCCCDGEVFATEIFGDTRVFDVVSGESLPYEASNPDDEWWEGTQVHAIYLVESCGEILRVTWYNDGDELVDRFEIYKLHSETLGQHEWRDWIRVGDIGDQIVFLDQVNGFSMKAPAGFKGNRIYFFYEDGGIPCVYDLDTREVEMLPCPLKNCTWFIPNLC